jgi:XTP/dITP diphosphohydrolase
LAVQLVPQGELGVGEAEEPFRTFVENALAKARHAAQHSGLPAIADDAGLCVDAFGGLPGVDTAYYATQFGYAKGDDNNVKALLEQMRASTTAAPRWSARWWRCAARRPRAAHRRRPRGRRDRARAHRRQRLRLRPGDVHPAFGKTFAQLTPEVKNANSHRGQAARRCWR